MNEDDHTQELSDRELLILLHRTVSESHRTVSELNERVGRLEAKAYDTQPLPVNFEARFTALEQNLAAFRREAEQNLAAFRRETKANFKLLREEFVQEKLVRNDLEERVELLESRPH